MKKYLIIVIIGLFSSCKMKVNQQSNQLKSKGQEKVDKNNNRVAFDFSAFPINKGGIGPIRIGMSIIEAEKHVNGLIKQVSQATVFGYGGGSPAYLYSLANDPVLVLIPKLDTDTTLFIIAVHKDLRTTNGLNPNSSVADLLREYPNLTINQDLMNSWEYASDTNNNWQFVFTTDEKQQVGEYPAVEVASKPKRLTVKANWITIK